MMNYFSDEVTTKIERQKYRFKNNRINIIMDIELLFIKYYYSVILQSTMIRMDTKRKTDKKNQIIQKKPRIKIFIF